MLNHGGTNSETERAPEPGRVALRRGARPALLAVAVAVAVTVMSGCGDDQRPAISASASTTGVSTTTAASDRSTDASTTTVVDASETSSPGPPAPAGSTAGLDDVDGDGEPDPTCGTMDLGAGLIVRNLCVSMAPENENGVVPVPMSSLSLAGTSFPETDNVDATVRYARNEAGQRVTIFQLGSDTLFDTGSSVIRSTATAALPGVASAITNNLSGGSITVRGHADSRGVADANQVLSQQRADAVAKWLGTAGGIPPGSIRAVGLGSSAPAALETTPDGAISEVGQTLNRRVEIVVVTAGRP